MENETTKAESQFIPSISQASTLSSWFSNFSESFLSFHFNYLAPISRTEIDILDLTSLNLLDKTLSPVGEKNQTNYHLDCIPLFTYRSNCFPFVINGTVIRSDAGWGCVLRTGQMSLATAFIKAQLSTFEAENKEITKTKTLKLVKHVIAYFIDTPIDMEFLPQLKDKNDSISKEFFLPPFGIHNVCCSACYGGKTPGMQFSNIEVINGMIEQNKIYDPFGVDIFSSTNGTIDEEDIRVNWNKRKALLYVSFCCNKGNLNDKYVDTVKQLFKVKGFCGIMAALKDSAIFVIGLKGEFVVYLDPHSVNDVVEPGESIEKTDFSSYFKKEYYEERIENLNGFFTAAFLMESEDDLKEIKKAEVLKFTNEVEQKKLADFVNNDKDDF